MLIITVGSVEIFDEDRQEFGTEGGSTLRLEHSLVALSKWESKHEKPFLSKDEKTTEEVLSYVECMMLDPKFPPEEFPELSQDNLDAVNQYINAKMTATWFNDQPGGGSSEIITAELIYYWMIAFQIPVEFEMWHLNRLFTLIRVCSVKQGKPKKMSKQEAASRQRELNALRRAQMGSSG